MHPVAAFEVVSLRRKWGLLVTRAGSSVPAPPPWEKETEQEPSLRAPGTGWES